MQLWWKNDVDLNEITYCRIFILFIYYLFFKRIYLPFFVQEFMSNSLNSELKIIFYFITIFYFEE